MLIEFKWIKGIDNLSDTISLQETIYFKSRQSRPVQVRGDSAGLSIGINGERCSDSGKILLEIISRI
jgi:hypothetical protein